MSEVLLLNARRRRRKPGRPKTSRRKAAPKRKTTTRRVASRRRRVNASTKGMITMARKRKRSVKRRRSPRRNPSTSRRRSIAKSARHALGGLNFKSALKDVPIQTLGMFAAKWASKFGSPEASETDPESWDYSSYLKGAAGAAGAGLIANLIKPGMGQRVLTGGLTLMLFKLVENELIPKSEWATSKFGADTPAYQPGDVEVNSAQEPFILGEDMQWHPMMGAALEPVGKLGYGDSLQTVSPLGNTTDAYRRTMLG